MSKKFQFKKRWHRIVRIGDSNFLKIAAIVLIVGLGVGYIGKINNTSTKGYAIHDLEVSVRELERENQRLSVEVAKYSSMQTVKQRVEQMGMREAEDIEYLTPVGSVVARK